MEREVMNENGMRIRKVCASCKYYKMAQSGNGPSTRVCEVHGHDVLPDEWCETWDMKDDLLDVGGDHDGSVKKLEYLMWVQEYRHRERKRITDAMKKKKQGAKDVSMSDLTTRDIGSLRREWESEHGCCFLNGKPHVIDWKRRKKAKVEEEAEEDEQG